jgi:hypothetical protein
MTLRPLAILLLALASEGAAVAKPRPPPPPPRALTGPLTASACVSCATNSLGVWAGDGGDFMVSFSPAGSGFRAFRRLFDVEGNGGPDVPVPGDTDAAFAGAGAVAGGWAIGWFEPGSRVLMQRLDASGMAVSDMIVVNGDKPAGADDDNGTMITADGRVVFVFSRSLPGSGPDPVVALLRAADGTSIAGPTTLGTSFNRAGAVACARPDGGAVAAWSLLAGDPLPDQPNPVGVAVGRLNATGTAAGPMVILQPSALLPPVPWPGQAVACAQDGSYTVAWHTNLKPAKSGWDVVWQRFDRYGRKRGGVQLLNGGQAGDQLEPAVMFEPDGSSLAVWVSRTDSGSTLVGRRFAAAGGAQGQEFPLHVAAAGQQADRPLLTVIPGTGRFVLGWSEGGQAWVQVFGN